MRRLSDGQLALVLSAALFALAAWPLLLVDYPPLQDLPNHLAAVTVIHHPDLYPDFVFNGLLKTNSSLYAWLLGVGALTGTRIAAKLFVALGLALGAIAYPRFVLAFGGRRRMVVSCLFAWPMVHSWFVSMGMLDFAVAVPLATLLLVALNAQRQRPTLARTAAIVGLSLLVWYGHAFPLLVVYLLVGLHVILRRTWGERWVQARNLALPLLPSVVLVGASVLLQAGEDTGAMTGFVSLGKLLPVWELVYNLWAEWFWAFTWFEILTVVPCVAVGLWAIYRWREDVPFFGRTALPILAALYLVTPYVTTNWFHVNSRFIPFLWLAALVRVPERLPRRWMAPVLVACAVVTSAGMGVDYVRLDHDRARYTAGIDAVPEGSTLLPLDFRPKGISMNTRSLLHAWGYYVIEKHTSAPLLFAHSRSFAVMYRKPPDPQFNHLVLEGFAPSMGTPDWSCGVLRNGGVVVHDCEGEWRARWAELWAAATPQFDHVLMWSAPPEVLALVPARYSVVFQKDELTIFARLH